MSIFSTFTSLLRWRISCVTSKSSNYTIVLINVTNGKPTTRLIVQYSRRRSYPTTPAVTRSGCMFMGCFHLPWPTVLRWQHSALYGNFKRKRWRPSPRCTDCWMDRGRLAVTVADLLNQSDCTRSLTLSVYYFVSYITYFIVVTDTGDVEDGNNTASVSSSTYFNVNIAH